LGVSKRAWGVGGGGLPHKTKISASCFRKLGPPEARFFRPPHPGRGIFWIRPFSGAPGRSNQKKPRATNKDSKSPLPGEKGRKKKKPTKKKKNVFWEAGAKKSREFAFCRILSGGGGIMNWPSFLFFLDPPVFGISFFFQGIFLGPFGGGPLWEFKFPNPAF